ncbi:MAG: tetrahydromethanopterin S-methyltransferase subunit A [Candidatus Thorarchaeota archaeon]
MTNSDKRKWPPVPGDYRVGNASSPVAICTLGKWIDVDVDYAILGTCKTENIGIERIIVNTISNPHIRFFILAGPEVPGHRTGASIRALFQNGVDPRDRRIVGAEGAIPYIENIPLEAIERFRRQLTLCDMLDVVEPERIRAAAVALISRPVEPLAEEPMWVDFGSGKRSTQHAMQAGSVSLVPELGLVLDPRISMVSRQSRSATVTQHPSPAGVEIQTRDGGTLLMARGY